MASKNQGKKRMTPKRAPPSRRRRPPSRDAKPIDECLVPPAADDGSSSDQELLEVPVAGIVASAGGLDAFKRFFKAMPADSGIAFVLVRTLTQPRQSDG